MTSPLSPEQLERLARKRAGAKLGWYVHAGGGLRERLVQKERARLQRQQGPGGTP